ncbi:DUF4440 domain-containing protein [Pseudoroseomonas deserti]|uniref:DUF4440 domain-containing protein n=1 Tax=Teichococcus deserti TaxID=1817963 RepID=A0A1V2GYM5_9PROT|nr:DUF4440 domain-containing protein [Pseudoroseomonas deserti]ONG50282.1 DUF4440 domain-containing protein [Pseudoroseomonas deserti]
MDDARIWEFEESLWTGDAQHYRDSISEECLMVLPEAPFILERDAAVEAVSATPRWSSVTFSDQQVRRPQEGLIVIAYTVRAQRDGGPAYEAHCSSVYRRLGHDAWDVVQHQQTPPLKATPQG